MLCRRNLLCLVGRKSVGCEHLKGKSHVYFIFIFCDNTAMYKIDEQFDYKKIHLLTLSRVINNKKTIIIIGLHLPGRNNATKNTL